MTMSLFASDLDYILEHTHDVWSELKNARLFITGGTGFFGIWLLESVIWANTYRNANCSVVVLTRYPDKFKHQFPHLADHAAIQLHEGDVRHFIAPTGKFTHIIHAATEASATLNTENPLLMLDTIVQGTRQCLEMARHCGTPSFLFISSGAVYGQQPPELTHIPECYQGAPDCSDSRSAYAHGKRMAEHLCIQYARQYNLPIKIARCFAFVGPYLPLSQHFAIGNFIRDALAGSPIAINGDGSPYRSYLYAADLTIWLWKILCRGQICQPYNVGSANEISVFELANLIANCYQPALTVTRATLPAKDAPPTRYVPDVARIQQALQLPPPIHLTDALARTIAWHKQQR